MKHRHIDDNNFSLPAIDDIISRGQWVDWLELHQAVQDNKSLLADVRRICLHYISDPYEQRYHFWYHYVEKFNQIP